MFFLSSQPMDTEVKGAPFPGGDAPGGGPGDGSVAPGTVLVEQVPPGRQSIRVGARRHLEVVQEVEVAPGQRVDLGEVRLRPLAR